MFGISMAPMTLRENRQPVGRIAGYA
jgi:hypothetical protein